jgi:hypothetical protein
MAPNLGDCNLSSFCIHYHKSSEVKRGCLPPSRDWGSRIQSETEAGIIHQKWH